MARFIVDQVLTCNVSGTSFPFTLTGFPLSPGDVLILQGNSGDVNQNISGISQNNVTWTQVVASNAVRASSIWQGVVGVGASTTITITTNIDVSITTLRNTICFIQGLVAGALSSGSNSGSAVTSMPTATLTNLANAPVVFLANINAGGSPANPTNNFVPMRTSNGGSQYAYLIAPSVARTINCSWNTTSNSYEASIACWNLTLDVGTPTSIPPSFNYPGGLLGKRRASAQNNNYNISVSGSITPDGNLSFVYAAASVVILGIQRVIHPLWNLPSSIFSKRSRGQYTNNSPAAPINYNISVGGSITPDGALGFAFNSHNFAIAVSGSIRPDGALSFVYHALTNYNIAVSGSIALDGALSFVYNTAGSLRSTVKSFWLKRHWRF